MIRNSALAPFLGLPMAHGGASEGARGNEISTVRLGVRTIWSGGATSRTRQELGEWLVRGSPESRKKVVSPVLHTQRLDEIPCKHKFCN